MKYCTSKTVMFRWCCSSRSNRQVITNRHQQTGVIVQQWCFYGSVAVVYQWISVSSSHTVSGVLCSGQPGPGTQIKAAFVYGGEQASICARMCVCVRVRACKRECASVRAKQREIGSTGLPAFGLENRCGFSTASYSEHTCMNEEEGKL